MEHLLERLKIPEFVILSSYDLGSYMTSFDLIRLVTTGLAELHLDSFASI